MGKSLSPAVMMATLCLRHSSTNSSQAKLGWRTSTAWRSATPSYLAGSSDRKAAKSSASNFLVAMNCQLGGPSFYFSRVTPICRNFMATKNFDAEDFAAFLSLLPAKYEGVALRHAVEVRHPSFACEEFVELCRKHNVAIITAGDSDFPMIADVSADFVYARIMGTEEKEKLGYSKAAISAWAGRAKEWSKGGVPKDLPLVAKPPAKKPRDVFLFVISGAKAKNPTAAQALIAAL